MSDTTLRFDLEVKARLYARHRIPEYWVIDLTNDRLHVHRDPREGRYAIATSVSDGMLRVPSLQAEVEVTELFP